MVRVNRGGSPFNIYRADLYDLNEVSITPLSTGLAGISLDEGPANAYVSNWSTSLVGVMVLTLMALIARVAIRRQYLS